MSEKNVPITQAGNNIEEARLDSLGPVFPNISGNGLKTRKVSQTSPGMPCYALTKEGEAIASLFPDKQLNAFHFYLKLLSKFLPDIEIKEYKKETGTERAQFIRTWKNGQPVAEV